MTKSQYNDLKHDVNLALDAIDSIEETLDECTPDNEAVKLSDIRMLREALSHLHDAIEASKPADLKG